MRLLSGVIATAAALFAGAVGFGGTEIAPIDVSADRNPSRLDPGLVRIGTLKPRSVREIASSPWMIDGATQDRDFVDFDEYSQYLEALGVKELRLMAGWAKTEKAKGAYDFAWLDHQVDWCLSHGIAVYLDISYGNPIYAGAGGVGLADGIPQSAEGLAAWDRWVETLARHYAGRVTDWAIWNEPDNRLGQHTYTIDDVTAFNVRTAKILKRILPDCTVNGFSLCGLDERVLARYEACLKKLGEDVRYFDTVAYHLYTDNPDIGYPMVERLRTLCATLTPGLTIRQTESGCPSEWIPRLALSNLPLSENTQAKWNLRRMLGDWGRGIRCSILHISDMNYTNGQYIVFNRKGLLRADSNHRIIQVKKSYYAMQNVTAVFDDTVRPSGGRKFRTDDATVSCFAFETAAGRPVLAAWTHGAVDRKTHVIREDRIPGESFETRPVVFGWGGRRLQDPVWVDLFTGAVYAFPEKWQICHPEGITFVRVPTYDSPFLLTERESIQLMD